MVSIASITVAPTRFTVPSSASESRPTEPVSHQASSLRAIVASAATMESNAYLRAPAAATSGRGRSRGGEGVREEFLFGEPALGGEIAARGVHHRWSAAGVDLVARQIREIRHHGLVHEPRAAGPAVRRG